MNNTCKQALILLLQINLLRGSVFMRNSLLSSHKTSCSLEGCLNCHSDNLSLCSVCQNGFYLTIEKKCVNCHTGCLECYDAQSCRTCSFGYKLEENFSCTKTEDGGRKTTEMDTTLGILTVIIALVIASVIIVVDCQLGGLLIGRRGRHGRHHPGF